MTGSLIVSTDHSDTTHPTPVDLVRRERAVLLFLGNSRKLPRRYGAYPGHLPQGLVTHLGMRTEVPTQVMELAGGDRFVDVRRESEEHQREHGCGLHNAGGPQMQLVVALARAAGVRRALDLGSGLGYSTLWIASAVAQGGSVIAVDDDPSHTRRASEIAAGHERGVRVEYVTGTVREVLPSLDGPFDMIHDDAWFAKTPDHLDGMLALLRPGGLLTMANWFLLADAITGEPRNDWESFAGPSWVEDTFEYANLSASRPDLHATSVTTPPIAFGTTEPSPDHQSFASRESGCADPAVEASVSQR